MANEFPSDWREQPCFVAVIPKPLVPFVGGMLKIMELRGFWTPEAYEDAYTAVVETEACLMATCLADLIDSQDRLYRMLDTALFGTAYTVVSTDPLVVTPAIPPARDILPDVQMPLTSGAAAIVQLTDNSINGTTTPLYDYTPSVKSLLADIKAAIEAGDSSDDDLLALLEQIALLLA